MRILCFRLEVDKLNEEQINDFEDDEFGDVYLIDEPEDIDLIMIPKLEINVDNVIEQYAKQLRKCKTLKEAKEVLFDLYTYASTISYIKNEIADIQIKAKNLEVLKQHLNF